MEHRIYINSADRISGSKSNFTIQLTHELIKRDPKTEVMNLSLENIVIPYNWYNINGNFFTGNGSTVTIPDGNYSVIDMETTLSSLTGLTVSWENTTSKFKFVNATGASYTIVPSTAARALGLSDTLTIADGGTAYSTQPTSLINTNSVLVHSNLSQNIGISYDNNEYRHTNIICKVPIEVQPFGNITASPLAKLHSANTYLNHLRFWITDESGSELDLQEDWSLVLKVSVTSRNRQHDTVKLLEDIKELIGLQITQKEWMNKKRKEERKREEAERLKKNVGNLYNNDGFETIYSQTGKEHTQDKKSNRQSG